MHWHFYKKNPQRKKQSQIRKGKKNQLWSWVIILWRRRQRERGFGMKNNRGRKKSKQKILSIPYIILCKEKKKE